MLELTIPTTKLYDEAANRFITVKGQTIQMEHSLVSLSRWESKWKKPFLSNTPKTDEETRDYARCMTKTQNVNPLLYQALSPRDIEKINAYITDPMTATTFAKTNRPPNRQVTTAEILYWKMAEHGIWKECETWHLNRLLTLIRVCDEKSQPGRKMSRRDAASRYRDLNRARRRRSGSSG